MDPSTIPTVRFNPLLIPIAIVIAGAIIAISLIFALRGAGTPQAGTDLPGGQQPSAQAADISKVKIESEPFIGRQNAPVTIAYWYDYQCPFCKQNEETAMPQLIKEYVDTGIVKVVFKDYQFLGADSQTAGIASRAVWETAPDKFYAWHKAMYERQDNENSGWGNKADILALTKQIVGADEAAQVEQLIAKNAAAYQREMDEDKTEGAQFGVSGTPGFIIGKQRVDGAVPYAQIKAAVESALSKK